MTCRDSGTRSAAILAVLLITALFAPVLAPYDPRAIDLRFWRRPVRILGEDRVSGLEIEATGFDEDGRLVGTGARETLDVGMVLRSIGYMGVPLPDLPFDEDTRTVPHTEGRVVDAEGRPVPGVYVAGWIKRGPVGLIGHTKSDAMETIRHLINDLQAALRQAEVELEAATNAT
jgi:ferredoxin/flavodoxin---NADP+ reductase